MELSLRTASTEVLCSFHPIPLYRRRTGTVSIQPSLYLLLLKIELNRVIFLYNFAVHYADLVDIVLA